MSKLDFIVEEIVTANRILANEGIVNSFGHVSARHPDKPDHYLLSRARAPERIEPDDIVEYKLDGTRDRRARPRALSRALHPRRHLRSAARTCSPSCITTRRA